MDVRLTDVLVADAKLLADGLLQPEDDMAVFVGRGGKGRVAPFTVRRAYTGAGGWYVESMALLAPNGDVAWRGAEQQITLRGSSKIDTFSDDIHGVSVDSADDHELVLLIAGDEVGRAAPAPAAGRCRLGTAPWTAASTSSPVARSSASPASPRRTGCCSPPAPRSCSRWWRKSRPAPGWCPPPTRCSAASPRSCSPAASTSATARRLPTAGARSPPWSSSRHRAFPPMH